MCHSNCFLDKGDPYTWKDYLYIENSPRRKQPSKSLWITLFSQVLISHQKAMSQTSPFGLVPLKFPELDIHSTGHWIPGVRNGLELHTIFNPSHVKPETVHAY